jgi:PAS domain S-box-containing protein
MTGRDTGLKVIGEAEWGTHFCQFYQTKEDLLDILVPYFKAGLEHNEFCIWVASEPLKTEDAKEALQKAIPNFSRYQSQIEIIPHTEWYLKGGSFSSKRVLNCWVQMLNKALSKGYDGLRLTGNTFWLERHSWRAFTDYEHEVNDIIGKYNIIALCSYSLLRCTVSDVLDVIANHQFALIKKGGKWEMIQGAKPKMDKIRQGSERKFQCLFDHEKRQAEKKIQDLAKFPSQNPYPVLRLASNGTILYHNNPARSLIKRWKRSIPPYLKKILKDALKQNKIVETEIRIGKKLFLFSLAPVQEGKYVNLYGIDISERERKEQLKEELSRKIKKERDLLDVIKENTGAHLAYLDNNFNIIDVNAVYAHGSNYKKADLIGKNYFQLFPDDESKKLFEKVRGTGKALSFTDKPFILPNQPERGITYCDMKLVPVRDANRNIGLVISLIDTTKRKKDEEKLIRANRTLKALSDTSSALIRYGNEYGLLKEVCRIISKDCGHAMVWVGYAQHDRRKSVKPVAYAGFQQGYIKSMRITWSNSKRGRGPTGTAIRTGKTRICANMLTDTRFRPWRKQALKNGYASSIVLPLLKGEKAFGALNIYSHHKDAFSKEEVRLLEELAGSVATGITSLQHEAEARKAQKNYRDLVDNAPVGVYKTNIKGDYLFVNDAFAKMMGFSSAAEMMKKNVHALYKNPKYRKVFIQTLRENKKIIDFENEMVTKNGKVKSVLVSAKLEGDEISGMIMDISMRKKVEENLRRSEERFRALTELSPTQIAVTRASDGIILFTNAAYNKAFGFQEGELIGSKAPDLYVYPKERDALLRVLKEKGAVQGYNILVRKKDAMLFWISASIACIVFDGVPALLGASINIDEQKKAEEQLNTITQDLKRAQEVAQAGNWRLDTVNNILTWSDENHKIFGVPKGTPLTYETFLSFIHPDDQSLVDAKWKAGLEGEPYDVEHRIIANGNIKWVREKAFLEFKDGKVIGGFGITQDITKRKKIEEQLRRLLSEKETLLKEVHHRVKNNMQMISSLIRLQARRIKNEYIKKTLEDSQNRIRSMALVHEILYKSENLSDINFSKYIKRIVSDLLLLSREKHVSLDLKIERVPIGLDSAIACGLIVNELVSNSLKYAFLGKGAGEISIKFITGKGRAKLTVKDNGVGLPENFNIHSLNSLGLQLVETFVKQLSGTLDISSKNGAEFSITFPIK